MKKGGGGPEGGGGASTSTKKQITAKIDTGRGRVVSSVLTTRTRTNVTSVDSRKGVGRSSSSDETLSTISSGRDKKETKLVPQPPPPSKGKKAFVKPNARISNVTALFSDEVDTQNLPPALIKNARLTGVLNLSGRHLISVPLKVWRLNELDESEKTTVTVSMESDNPEDKWWEFVDLQKLIIANNYIKDVPCDVSNLISLQVFDAHDNHVQTVSKDIGKLTNLSKLDLSRNQLTLLPEEIGQLKRLRELYLSHNNLEDIPSSFGNLSCLKVLDLSYNNLTTFPEDFGFLSFLEKLCMSNNKISKLPEDIGGLTGIKTLDLSENGLKSLPAAISDLIHLEILYLQRNKIDEIPELSKAKNLKEVHLRNNIIRKVDSGSFVNTKLNLLDLRANKIDTLDMDPDDFEFLERLYLDNNNITQLPEELCLFPSIKALTLDGNPIRGIRLDILQRGTQEILKYLKGRLELIESSEQGCTINQTSTAVVRSAVISPPRRQSKSPGRRRSGGSSVEELGIDPFRIKGSKSLVLSGREIKDLETNVFQVAADSGVNIIDLSKNLMTSLPPSIDLCYEWLTELKLEFNKLSELPGSLCKCSRLQFLSVHNNQLTRIPDEFSHLKQLREVNLAFNRLDTFPPCLYEIPALEIVNLDSNRLLDLDALNLKRIKRLAVLDVRNNNISVLPAEIGLITQLRSLCVEGNAFRVPSYQIISKGTDAIMAYLRNRLKE